MDTQKFGVEEKVPNNCVFGQEIDITALYLTIINNLQDGIYFVDTNRKILFWNKAAERITGYSAEEIVGKCCEDSLLNHIDEEGRPLCTMSCPLFASICDCTQHQDHVFVRHKEGYRIPIFVNIFPMQVDGKVIGAIEIFTKRSPLVYDGNLVERLSEIAMHDSLTQLANRRYLESFIQYKFDEYKRFGTIFAVLFADIDDFRYFNNNYGHEVGDNVLLNIAKSLKQNMRRGDLIGRWGGEEFVGVYSLVKEEDAPALAEKFRQLVLNTSVTMNGAQIGVSISVGITVVRQNDTMSSIINRADSLMYSAKESGKNRVNVG
ncbi:MAG: GGDEF domain-containing protein [Treponema sp.]|nr:GGDEF domain-containing protein [Treponema sp.]